MKLSFLSEFRSSAIPDRMTLANVKWVEGDAAVQVMAEQAIAKVQKVSTYVTRSGRKLLDKYQFAADGGWLAYGCTIDGEWGEVPYFKPLNPPVEFNNGKLKKIKYPNPQGYQALPILPWVDDETAQQIYNRYGVTPLEGETFWRCVWRCTLPIGVTEGLKKALAMTAHGLPTIALRGIACWHQKGTNELHSVLREFATSGRSIHISFDQDEKVSTQIDVRRQTLKLGQALESAGCKVFVQTWDGSLGKGIDDVLAAKGDDAQAWLDDLIKNAPTLHAYRKYGRVTAALRVIEQLNKLSYPVERETEGEYLPELPELEQGKIHAVLATMNSGKTVRIGADWVKAARSIGWNVLVLAPLISLGQQTSIDWDLPHIHDFGTSAEQQQALWSKVSHDHGIVLCPDSLHRVPEWFWQRPVLLVLDEANQVIEHSTQGNTLGSRWADILERIGAAANHAIQTGAIVLSEDGLPDRAVKFISEITGCNDVRVFKHTKQGGPWDCRVFKGQASGFRANLLNTVSWGGRILFVTSSQQEGRRLERVLAKVHSNRKVIRIDSQTNQQGAFTSFFETPDEWLKQNNPDVLILSPSAKSGISIEGNVAIEDAYFTSVWAYFPALATDTHLQLLGRYRPSVPRFIFVPQVISCSGDESLMNPRAIQRRLNSNARSLAGVYELDALLDARDDRAETIVRIETAVLDYHAAARTVAGAQKAIAHDALLIRLEASGHLVQCEKLTLDRDIAKLWKDIQDELWREDAQTIASMTIEPEHDLKWAKDVRESLNTSLETRIRAQKVLWRDEFPSIDFDEPEQCYQALYLDYGAMRRGVLLQARAENLEATKVNDRTALESIANAKIRALHRLPKNYVRALLIAKTSILELLNGQTYTNSDPRAIAVKKAALYFANEISYWLRLQIKADQTPVEICNKLLKKLGLEAEATSRPGKRDERRDRVWKVRNLENSVRCQLLNAARRKLSGSVSTICNRSEIPYLQIVDTKQNPPDLERKEGAIEVGSLVRKGTSLATWVVEAIEGTIATIRQITGYSSRLLVTAPLSELEVSYAS
ncbi:MAG TPA: DUF3854 domain-containing protein [Trichocoleus sp.]|jgi:hypothetical protein